MKIVNLDKFLELPPGTLYAKGQPWAFENVCVKGDSIVATGDWTYRDLAWIDSSGDADQWSKLDEMLEGGVSQPMPQDYGRDGCFDRAAIFLVFELEDLRQLRGIVDHAIGLA